MRHLVLLTTLAAVLATGCDGDATATDTGSVTDTGGTIGDCTDPTTWYGDNDSDGFGAPDAAQDACDAPAGFVDNSDDCDDSDDSVNPDADELCDGADNDCNDAVDDDPVDPVASYSDLDSDGYGDPDTEVLSCEPASGTVGNDRDCNDGDADIWPSATETCDFVDQDCDELIDEGAEGATEYHPDADDDGYGDATASTWACDDPPEGYTLDASDCDDSDSQISPNGAETCDGEADEDCDGTVDEANALNTTTYYADQDVDGFGDPANSIDACTAPSGYGLDDTDCNDSDATEYPGATWYSDNDNDSYGDPDNSNSCERNLITDVATNDDCNDNDATVHPGASELCDGQLNDCLSSGLPSDESDADGDGWVTCTVDAGGWDGGAISGGEDCDDGDSTETPSVTWYADADGDGYGTSGSTNTCERASGSDVTNADDCDDGDSGVSPAATEVCDSADQDCDGDADEGVQTTYYTDFDGDGYGSPSTTTLACSVPSGYTANSDDCDDTDSGTNPAATEVCDGFTDEDCDTSVDEGVESTYYRDSDADSYGNASDSKTDCSAPVGYVTDATDCDDTTDGVNPGASELCDGVDTDCNTVTSEDGLASWINNATGMTTDVTADLTPAGGSVASYSTTSAGELQLCDGTWNVALDINANATIRGMSGDRDQVVLDGLGGARLVTVDKNGLDVALLDLTITNGYATDDQIGIGYYSGGGVSCNGVGTTVTLDNVVIESSYGQMSGAISSSDCTLDIADSELTGNEALYGGAGFLDGTQLILTNTIVSDNVGSYGGGAFYLYTSAGPSSLDMTDSQITGNSTASGYGGGIYGDGGSDTLDILCKSSSITNNSSANYGGGVLLYGYSYPLSFEAQACNFGTSAGRDLNNGPALTVDYTYDYEPGDDATFTCDEDNCGEPGPWPIGDATNEYGSTAVAYWNIVLATNPGNIIAYNPTLRSEDGTCYYAELYLLSTDDYTDGTWDLEWYDFQTMSPSSSYSAVQSNPIDVTVEPGLYYAFVTATDCGYSLDVKYGYDYTEGTDVGFGELVGGNIVYGYTAYDYLYGYASLSSYSTLTWAAEIEAHGLR